MSTLFALWVSIFLDKYTANWRYLKALQLVRQEGWLNTYVKILNPWISEKATISSHLKMFILLVPFLIGVGLLSMIVTGLFGSIGHTILLILALYYCLGDKAFTESEVSVLVKAHESTFGILFWFLLAGSVGALGYWLLSRLAEKYTDTLPKAFYVWHGCLSWLPARITGLIYALVGNFNEGFQAWQRCMRELNMQSSRVLLECGQAATQPASKFEHDALVNRAFVAWFVLCTVVIIAGWSY